MRPAVNTPCSDPYHRYFRRLLRAPPCHNRRGTTHLRLRSGAMPAAPTGNPRLQEEAGSEGKVRLELLGERASVEVAYVFAC